jgi:voltage-gated potassium channel Kch
MWWSFTTITTVGYGDYYPVTAMGKLIAVMLMIGAIGLVASMTAIFASWILERVAKEDLEANEAAVAAHIAELLRRHGLALMPFSTDGDADQGTRLDDNDTATGGTGHRAALSPLRGPTDV